MREVINTICCDECGNEIVFNTDEYMNEMICSNCMCVYSVKKLYGSLVIEKV